MSQKYILDDTSTKKKISCVHNQIYVIYKKVLILKIFYILTNSHIEKKNNKFFHCDLE